MNDYLKSAIELLVNGSTEFDFEDKEVFAKEAGLMYSCCKCGKLIIPSKETLGEAFKNWGHASCINNKHSH